MTAQTQTQGTYLELAENRNYLELTNLVCFYNSPNMNGLQLDYGETEEEHKAALEKAETLVDMPVYAYCTVNAKMEPTFSGHEAQKKKDGTYEFKTVPIGVHQSVTIEEREVTLADGSGKAVLPCLLAHQRIWKRNANAVAAIRRLFSEKQLFNSYEMEVSEYHFSNGIRHAIDYEFIGNAFLARDSIGKGKTVRPAYGESAAVLSVAEAEVGQTELMIAEALALDLEQEETEVNTVNENEKNLETATQEEEPKVEEVEVTPEVAEQEEPEKAKSEVIEAEAEVSAEVAEEQAEEPEQEMAALTELDIRRKLERLSAEALGEGWLDQVFPEEHVAWYKKYKMDALEFEQVHYEVVENEVNILSHETVRLELPMNRLVETYISQKAELENQKAELEQKDQQIAELSVYKEKFEAAEKETKVSALREMAEQAGCFSEEEMTEMAELFENLQETEIKVKIADKLMSQPRHMEQSEVTPVAVPKQNLDNDPTDRVSAMKRWLGR